MAARLREKYDNLKPELQSELGIENKMQIPAIEKIIISVGAGFAMKDNKLMQNIQQTISTIAGQHASIIFAKKSVAGFKVREGMPVGESYIKR
jgi:large subunit ribosomal protein L5